jgi:O-antigen ligase
MKIQSLEGFADLAERTIALVFLAFPLWGTFFPLEAYLAPQDFALSVRSAPTEVALSSTMIMVALLGMLIVVSTFRSRLMLIGIWRALPLILYLAYLVLTAWYTGYPGRAINRSGRHILYVLYAIYLVQAFDFEDLMKLLVRASAISVAASFLAMALLPHLAYSHLEGYAGAWRGAFVHKNALGEHMVYAAIFGFYGFGRGIIRPTALFAWVGAVVLLVTSRSLTSMVALAAAAAVGMIIVVLPTLDRAMKICFAITGGAVVLAALLIPYDAVFELLGRDPSLTGRSSMWWIIERFIEMRPILGFGHGFWGLPSGPRQEIWEAVGWATPEAHNTWLDISLQLGAVGLALFLASALVALTRSVRLIVMSPTSRAGLWLVVLSALFARSFTETEIVDPSTPFIFALTFCAIARLNAEVKFHHRLLGAIAAHIREHDRSGTLPAQ